MQATNNSRSQTLLAQCVHHKQDARDLPAAFDNVAQLLNRRAETYVFVGRCGRARFCRAQWTDFVNLRIKAHLDVRSLAEELQRAFAASLSTTSSLRLEVKFVKAATELQFIECAPLVRWFDVGARMATAEHLLWLALSSKASESHSDAVDLIQSGHIDWSTFHRLATGKNLALLRRLAIAKSDAERTKHSSFCKSMEMRSLKL